MGDPDEDATVFEGNKLQRKVTVSGSGDAIGAAAVERAEQALSELSGQFDSWIDEEVARLATALDAAAASGYTGPAGEDLFRVAHDIKGEADTLGYPLITRTSASLCYLLEAVKNGAPLPRELVMLHVDTVRAMTRDRIRGTANATAVSLFTTLATVTNRLVEKHLPAGQAETGVPDRDGDAVRQRG
jgi:chemotaxis protein histidine kinase CheA